MRMCYVAAQYVADGLRRGMTMERWFPDGGRSAGDGASGGPDGSCHAGCRRLVWRNKRGTSVDLEAPLVFVGYGLENARPGSDGARTRRRARSVVAERTPCLEGAAAISDRCGAAWCGRRLDRESREATRGRLTSAAQFWERRRPGKPGLGRSLDQRPRQRCSRSGCTYEEIRQCGPTGGRRGFPVGQQCVRAGGPSMVRNVTVSLPGGDPGVCTSGPEDPEQPGAGSHQRRARRRERHRDDDARGRPCPGPPQRPRRSVIFPRVDRRGAGTARRRLQRTPSTVPIPADRRDVGLAAAVSFTDVVCRR